MLHPALPSLHPELDNNAKKRVLRPPLTRRSHSISRATKRTRSPVPLGKKPGLERRCQSLSPSNTSTKNEHPQTPKSVSAPQASPQPAPQAVNTPNESTSVAGSEGKDPVLPQCVLSKMSRLLATKKREFLKMKKSVILQQNAMLEHFAAVKELESKVGASNEERVGEVRILSVSDWPAHDLLLLVRDDISVSMNSEISGLFGSQVLQQLSAQLNPIPEEVLGLCAELMAHRMELLNLLRQKQRPDIKASYLTNLEWKTKNIGLDQETEKLQRMVAGTAENLKAKINHALKLARVPWLDRDLMVKRIERLQKEILILQNKMYEVTKTNNDDNNKNLDHNESTPTNQSLSEELSKERAAHEALKEVVSAAESMLRVARARIATLERQLKETRIEHEATRRKLKDVEQLVNRLALEHSQKTYRHRESTYDARSKKLLEVSKTGEVTIESLSKQRDALELRVKELREQAELAEKAAEARQAANRARAESLQAKVAQQEKCKMVAVEKVGELEAKVKQLEEQLSAIKEQSARLLDMERRKSLQFVPTKEIEPTDRETEIWKELQIARDSLARTEEELRQSREDKDNFLNSLSKIAQEAGMDNNLHDKMATELLDREKSIMKLQQIIKKQQENEKQMEETMTQYENQLATLRMEVKRLRNYDCYVKEVPEQELQTELLELHMRVETLSRERTALVTAAASRALMLERHERAAELFAKMTRARRDLAALLDGRSEPPVMEEAHAELSRSLSSMCANSADTWSALRAERARVLRLEGAVLAQSLQLEREGRVRTQLERRRTIMERDLLRMYNAAAAEQQSETNRTTSLIQDFLWNK